jgi:hypothetical protein
MNMDRFQELLDAYGAEPARWPEAERDAASALLADSGEARARLAEARALDELLDRAGAPAALRFDAAELSARIAETPKPRLDPVAGASGAQVSMGWPSLAGLAAAAVAGFVIGWSGLGVDLGLANGGDFTELLSSITITEGTLW